MDHLIKVWAGSKRLLKRGWLHNQRKWVPRLDLFVISTLSCSNKKYSTHAGP